MRHEPTENVEKREARTREKPFFLFALEQKKKRKRETAVVEKFRGAIFGFSIDFSALTIVAFWRRCFSVSARSLNKTSDLLLKKRERE